MRVLVVNAGSSSLKLSVLGADDVVADGVRAGHAGRRVRSASVWNRPCEMPPRSMPSGTASSTVAPSSRAPAPPRGGVRAPARADSPSWPRSTTLPPSPPSSACSPCGPTLPQVACFDTAFHVTMPPEASTYALPDAWRDLGLAALRLPRPQPRLGQPAGRRAPREYRSSSLRLVTAHLGAGASLAAVSGGRSVDTTMGFTPLEGLVMATRSGSVDPGLLLWVLRHEQLTVDELEDALDRRSGSAGAVGGVGGPARRSSRPRTEATSVRSWPSASTSTGCGPGSAPWWRPWAGSTGWCSPAVPVRGRPGCAATLVPASGSSGSSSTSNATIPTRVGRPTGWSHADGTAPAVLVVHAREDLEIARQVRALLAPSG